MHIELNDRNTEKLRKAAESLQSNPNSIANVLIDSVDDITIKSIVTICLRVPGPAPRQAKLIRIQATKTYTFNFTELK